MPYREIFKLFEKKVNLYHNLCYTSAYFKDSVTSSCPLANQGKDQILEPTWAWVPCIKSQSVFWAPQESQGQTHALLDFLVKLTAMKNLSILHWQERGAYFFVNIQFTTQWLEITVKVSHLWGNTPTQESLREPAKELALGRNLLTPIPLILLTAVDAETQQYVLPICAGSSTRCHIVL